MREGTQTTSLTLISVRTTLNEQLSARFIVVRAAKAFVIILLVLFR